MGRIYSARFAVTNMVPASGDIDWVTFQPHANATVKLHKLSISQKDITKDANEAALNFSLLRLWPTVTVSGSGGAELPFNPNDGGALVQTTTNSATVATTTGATDIVDTFDWNWRNGGFERIWDEKCRPAVVNGQALILRMNTAIPVSILGVRLIATIEEY